MEIEEDSKEEKLRKLLKELILQKDEMEKEIKELTISLTSQGFDVRGKKGLIDEEGFPIAELDKVLSVRERQNKFAMLQTDHVKIMKEIEENMILLHQTTAGKVVETRVPKTIEDEQPKTILKPFAIVNEVSQFSPALVAGLLPKDLILQFGEITFENHNELKALASFVNQNEGKEIRLVIHRKEFGRENIKELKLTPRKWSGRGLLGYPSIFFHFLNF